MDSEETGKEVSRLTSTATLTCTCGREQPMLLYKATIEGPGAAYCDECNPEDTSKEAKADFTRLRQAMRIRKSAKAQGFHTGI